MLRYFAGWKSAAWQMRRFIQNQQPGERLRSSGGWRLEAVENGGPKMGMPVPKELFREHACGLPKARTKHFPKMERLPSCFIKQELQFVSTNENNCPPPDRAAFYFLCDCHAGTMGLSDNERMISSPGLLI